MEQLKQKLEQLENKSATTNISEASIKNQVQPKTEPQSMTNPSAVMDLDDRINAWGDENDQLKKKLRYILYFFILFRKSLLISKSMCNTKWHLL